MKKDILIKIHLERKYIFWFRCSMFVCAVISLIPIWNGFSDGYIVTRGSTYGAFHMVSFMYYLKFVMISGLFVWLGTGGIKEKQ